MSEQTKASQTGTTLEEIRRLLAEKGIITPGRKNQIFDDKKFEKSRHKREGQR